MKIVRNNIIKVLLSVFICLSITAFANADQKVNSEINQNFKISKIIFNPQGPNVADMLTQYQKTIKPFIEKPFLATEVDKLTDEKKRQSFEQMTMTNALLVGPSPTKGSEV